jgi:hypothetical protein
MPIVVSPTTTDPTHHIKLSDGSNEVGLILRAGNRIDPRAITRRPRQNGQYSPFTQSDWGSGRGIKDASSDRSRFADSKRLITRHPGTVMIGAQETYTTGYRQAEKYMPGNLTWKSLLTTNRYIAYSFSASASGNRGSIYLWVRRRGTPTSTLTVELCSNNAGNPGTVLKTVNITTNNITDTISQLYEFNFSSVQAVVSGTVYWVKVYTFTADTTTDYWEVGVDAAGGSALTKSSSNGSSWSAASYDLYFRIVDDTDLLGGFFFYYKSQVYFLTRPSGAAAPKLYFNGFRGTATGAGQSTTTMQDTTKNFGAANSLVGAVLLFFEGTLSGQIIPYRVITSNTSDTITFSTAFPTAPVAGNSCYVVLGSNVWTEITGHGLTVLPTSVTSAGEVCYFAQGDQTAMRRMREYLSGTTWTREFAAEDNYAKFLVTFKHPTKGLAIGKANDFDNSWKPSFAQATVEAWGSRLKFPLLVTNCEDTSGWTAGAGASIATDNANFVTFTKSIKITVSSGPANPVAYFVPSASLDFSRRFTNLNLAGQRYIRFWFRADANRAAGTIKIFPSASATAASTIEDLNLPALVANEWTQIVLPFTDTNAGLEAVASIGLRVTASTGNYWIDGIEIIPAGAEVPLGNKGERITGLNMYGDPEVPWVFRSQSAGSVENGVFNPIPLRELSTAENIHNGGGNVVHNVYLYFSFLHGLERFYRNNLDDVGPNRDEGLPDGRRGYITSMQGYIGRFFYDYDVLDGYSCIMESTSGADHHEVYRCDTPGKRIRQLFIQVIPGDVADRLWFTEGDDIAWLPLPGNTLKEDTDDTFRFTHEAALESGWITGSDPEAVKIFSSVRLFTENTTSNRKIEWDYRTDDNTAWTAVSTAFTSPPVQEINLNVSAKRLKLRFRMQTNDNTQGPKIKQLFVSATTRPETRYTYTMNTTLEDRPINLRGDEDSSISANALLTQLDAWTEANTILTMSSVFTPYHGKSVILEPVVTQPLTLVADESLEKLTATLILLEP